MRNDLLRDPTDDGRSLRSVCVGPRHNRSARQGFELAKGRIRRQGSDRGYIPPRNPTRGDEWPDHWIDRLADLTVAVNEFRNSSYFETRVHRNEAPILDCGSLRPRQLVGLRFRDASRPVSRVDGHGRLSSTTLPPRTFPVGPRSATLEVPFQCPSASRAIRCAGEWTAERDNPNVATSYHKVADDFSGVSRHYSSARHAVG